MDKFLSDIKKIHSDHMANLAELGTQMREQKQIDLGYAHVIFESIRKELEAFQSKLKPDEEVGAYLSSFGEKTLILVNRIGFHNPYLIIFKGTDVNSKEQVQLIQHTSQISLLFIVLKKDPKENRKAARIGFYEDKVEAEQ